VYLLTEGPTGARARGAQCVVGVGGCGGREEQDGRLRE